MRWALGYAGGFTASQRLSDSNQGSHALNFESQFRLSPHVNLRVAENFSLTSGLFASSTMPNNNGTSGKLTGKVDQRLSAYFDRSVYSQPAAFTFGNLASRVPDIRVDGVRNFDLSLFKDFRVVERVRVQFRAEFLNAFNTPRFGGPNTSVTSSSFGVISSQANAPRQIQFGLKVLW